MALSQIRDSLVRLTATIEILMYIYKNHDFSPYNTGIEYTKTLFAEEKHFALYHSFSFYLPSLSRSFFLLSHFPITHAYIEGYAFVFVKRGRVSALYISLLYSFFVYGKSIKDYWFSFCVCCPSFPPRIPSIIRFGFVGPVWQCLVH